MIVGVGTDLVDITRVKRACERQGFVSRIYTKEECRQAGGNVSRLAGNFAVKEAVAKSFGTGFRGFWPGDIEVLRDELGKPYVILHGEAERIGKELRISRIHVSISNTKEYAVAYVTAETEF